MYCFMQGAPAFQNKIVKVRNMKKLKSWRENINRINQSKRYFKNVKMKIKKWDEVRETKRSAKTFLFFLFWRSVVVATSLCHPRCLAYFFLSCSNSDVKILQPTQEAASFQRRFRSFLYLCVTACLYWSCIKGCMWTLFVDGSLWFKEHFRDSSRHRYRKVESHHSL